MGGVLVVDKPRGPTSHDVVAQVRKKLRTREVGHAGTLDPMATGVLVIAVGEATKLVPYLTADDKEYEVTLRLGIATDTLDAEGTETERRDLAGMIDEATLSTAVAREKARALQVPPAYSAVHVDGRRAHEIARGGGTPELAPRPVAVRTLEILASALEPYPHVRLRVVAAKGYYVRSLARDFAEACGTVGHLTSLRRTRSGAFTLEDAVPLEDIAPEKLLALPAAASRALPVSVLTEAGVREAGFGRRVPTSEMDVVHAGPSAWLDAKRRLVAIGEVAEDGRGRVIRGFATSS